MATQFRGHGNRRLDAEAAHMAANNHATKVRNSRRDQRPLKRHGIKLCHDIALQARVDLLENPHIRGQPFKHVCRRVCCLKSCNFS